MTSIKQFGPREKLLLHGAQSLTTHELLMVLIGSGGEKNSVGTIARKVERILQKELPGNMKKTSFHSVKGIGEARTCVLLSAIEFSHRLSAKHMVTFTSPETVGAYLHEIRESSKETVMCLYLSARYTLVHKEVLAIGSLNQSLIYPREVFYPIRHHPVAYIILAHNHPSGDPTPSEEDKMFTERVRSAGEIIGVELLDHIILAKTEAFSMKEHGWV